MWAGGGFDAALVDAVGVGAVLFDAGGAAGGGGGVAEGRMRRLKRLIHNLPAISRLNHIQHLRESLPILNNIKS